MKVDQKYKAFYREYDKLCRKYGLMVLSDGEPVVIGEVDRKLWGLWLHTVRDLKFWAASKKRAVERQEK